MVVLCVVGGSFFSLSLSSVVYFLLVLFAVFSVPIGFFPRSTWAFIWFSWDEMSIQHAVLHRIGISRTKRHQWCNAVDLFLLQQTLLFLSPSLIRTGSVALFLCATHASVRSTFRFLHMDFFIKNVLILNRLFCCYSVAVVIFFLLSHLIAAAFFRYPFSNFDFIFFLLLVCTWFPLVRSQLHRSTEIMLWKMQNVMNSFRWSNFRMWCSIDRHGSQGQPVPVSSNLFFC